MSIANKGQSEAPPSPEDFIRNALAEEEKAHRFQRIRQIVITVLAFAAAFWLASKQPSPELGIECTIVIVLGLALAVCTAKINSLINKNTRVILQAIADLHSKIS